MESPLTMRANPQSEVATAAPAPELAGGASRLSSPSTMLVLQSRALSHDTFAVAAASVVADLAVLMSCERVSFGLHARKHVRVTSMSGAGDLRAHQDAVRRVSDAMQEALGRRCAIVHPLPPETETHAAPAHAELARINCGMSICTVPILCGDRASGALMFERRESFDARSLEIANDAALFVGPVLVLQKRAEDTVRARLRAATGLSVAAKDRTRWCLISLASAMTLIAISTWPVTYRVVATARVEGEAQRVIAAPVDGFVRSVAARPGETVKRDQVVLQLEDEDMALEREGWESEITKLDKQYRDSLSREEAGSIVIAASKLDEARAKLALAQRQLERTTLKAPFDGVVISGDLSQSIGMPVRRGQELVTMATERAYRIVAEVDEQDIADLRVGQTARALFAAMPNPVSFRVARISPVATTADGRNVFEVESGVTPATEMAATLRPGLRGIAKIEIEPSLIAVVCWRRAGRWLRHTAWRLVD